MAISVGAADVTGIAAGGIDIDTVSDGDALVWQAHNGLARQVMHRDPTDPHTVPYNSWGAIVRWTAHPDYPWTNVSSNGLVVPHNSDGPTRIRFGVMESNDSIKDATYRIRLYRGSTLMLETPGNFVPAKQLAVVEYVETTVDDLRTGDRLHLTCQASISGINVGSRYVEYCYGDVSYNPRTEPPFIIGPPQ